MIAVIGAGAFGTALAVAEAASGRTVRLWGRDPAAMATADARPRDPAPARRAAARGPRLHRRPRQPRRRRGNPPRPPRPGHRRLPRRPRRRPAARPARALRQGHRRRQPTAPRPGSPPPPRPGHALAALTGPGFAAEIARGLPTALTLACADAGLGRSLQQGLATRRLRLYLTDDVIGAELGGALKNVIAIACGMVDGARLGASARAALMTRGFAEMTRLAVAMGARPETLAGLSGLGDLSLTCSSGLSRNFALGRALGAGEARPPAGTGGTVEGVATARAACRLGAMHRVELPIAAAVADVLEGATTLAGAIEALLARPLREE